MPYRFIIAIGLALLPIAMARCANQEAFAATNYAKCQQLGFAPETQYYNMCLSQVQQQRTAGVTEPEPIPGETQQFPHRREPPVAIDPDNGYDST